MVLMELKMHKHTKEHRKTDTTMYSTIEQLYTAYTSGAFDFSEIKFNESIVDTLEIPEHHRKHFAIALTNWKDSLFNLISDDEKQTLQSYLVKFNELRESTISNIQKEFLDSIQNGDIDTFKRLYKTYPCDMYNIKKQLFERCLKSNKDVIIEYYITERFVSMSNLFKYFTDKTDVINVIAKCHDWNTELMNGKVISMLQVEIDKHKHLFIGKDAPGYIKEFMKNK